MTARYRITEKHTRNDSEHQQVRTNRRMGSGGATYVDIDPFSGRSMPGPSVRDPRAQKRKTATYVDYDPFTGKSMPGRSVRDTGR